MTHAPPPGSPPTRLDRRKALSLLLVPAYMVIIAVLGVLGLEVPINEPYLLLLLNVVFLGLIPIYVAAISLVSFRQNGLASILMMGAGMLFFGLASIAAGLAGLLPDSSNLVVTNHNVGACIGAFLQFAGALTAFVGWREGRAELRAGLARAVYAGVGVAAAGLFAAALLGLTPAFLAPGTGSTVLRTLVLAGAVVFSLLASVLFFVLYRRREEDFFFWYAVGMALIGLGLLAVSFYAVFDDLLNWAARFGQYVGACYILVAFLVLRQRVGSGGLSVQELLTSFFTEAEAGYRELVETAGDAIVVLDPALRVLLWNTAAESLFGYADDEAVGRSFPDLVLGDADVPALRDAAAGSGPRPRRQQALEARRKDGSRVPVEMTVSRRDVAGRAITTCIVRDLTERRRAERALRESEERYRSLFENSIDAVLLTEPDGAILAANPEASRIFGMTGEELVSSGRDAIVDPSDPRLAAALEARQRTGRFRGELGFRRRDGTVFPGEVSTSLFTDGSGVVRTTMMIRDVTERREAEETLVRSEARYRELFEAMTGGFALHEVVLDAVGTPVDYRFLAVNPAFEAMTGLEADGAVGSLVSELQPDLDPVWVERYGRVATTGEPDRFVEYSTPLGRWYDVYAFSPSPGRFATIFRDVTAERETTEALRRRAEEVEALMDLVPAAVWVGHDPACRSITGNRAANELYEADSGENVSAGRPAASPASPRRFFAPDGRELAPDELPMQAAAAQNAAVPNAEFEVQVPSGRRRHLLGSAVPLREADGAVRGAIAAFLDITERKDAEAALRRSNEELQRFAYVASHDLQEPLRSIVSFSQLLERRYKGQLGEDADEYIGFIVEGGTRMQTLIRDLLEVSRVETAARPLAPTDAGEVVAGALRLLAAPIREAGATVEVGPMPRVLADAAQLEQVFANLVGNAIKYGRAGVLPEIRVSATERGGWWEFAVHDNGIGIEAQYFDRIFEMFRRLHTRDQYEGTGIGLAIVKRIVERHGGAIRVESAPGEGSAFFFTLPAA